MFWGLDIRLFKMYLFLNGCLKISKLQRKFSFTMNEKFSLSCRKYLLIVPPYIMNFERSHEDILFTPPKSLAKLTDNSHLVLWPTEPNHQWQLLDSHQDRTVFPNWKKNFFATTTQLIQATVTAEMKICKSHHLSHHIWHHTEWGPIELATADIVTKAEPAVSWPQGSLWVKVVIPPA